MLHGPRAMPSHAIVLATRLALESGATLSQSAVEQIRRSLEGLATLGIREVAVVDGRHVESLRERLELHTLPQLNVRVLANLSWKNLSGSALLVARRWIEDSERCLVVRGDRPLDVESLRLLVQLGREHAADYDAAIVVANAPALDPDAFRVRLARGSDTDLHRVAELGEDLAESDGVFTGHALVNRTILDALARLPNPSLEHGLLDLVQRGRVIALHSSWLWGAGRPLEVEAKVTALLDAKRHARYVLLNPGPVNTTATVKSALVHHDVCHRDVTFSELMVSLTGKLRRIFRGTPHHTVFPITGSGTAAMEAALASSVPPDKKLLIIDNGAFGERLVEVARVHEMDVLHLRYAWGEEIAVSDVARALAADADLRVAA